MSDMEISTGDLKPDLQITLSDTDDAGSPLAVNIDDADSVRIIGQRDGLIVFDREPTTASIVGATSVLTMEFEPGDTEKVGRIYLEVEVMWPAGKPQTFPFDEAIDVRQDFDH